VENSLWKGLWTHRKADCGINESCGNKMGEMCWIQLAKDGDKLKTFIKMVMSIQVVIFFFDFLCFVRFCVDMHYNASPPVKWVLGCLLRSACLLVHALLSLRNVSGYTSNLMHGIRY
jgi:hypothetical protein